MTLTQAESSRDSDAQSGGIPSSIVTEKRARILVVDDDEVALKGLEKLLCLDGFAVSAVADGEAALAEASRLRPDIVLTDLHMPKIDGTELCRRLHELAPDLPIIVMTARTNEHDRVEVLGLGADDVVSKPFSMRELVARVTAAVRRASVAQLDAERQEITAGDLVIDPDRLAVTIAGQPIDLTPLEFKLLWVLTEHRGRALSRDVIYQRVWRAERGHGDRSVDVLVRRLRRKVDEIGGAYTYVQTQHGVGYRFDAMLRQMPAGAVRGATPEEPRPSAHSSLHPSLAR